MKRTQKQILAEIVKVTRALLTFGNVVLLEDIAKNHAKVNGSTAAEAEVERLKFDWLEILRADGYPVVPMTQFFLNQMAASTPPATPKDKRRSVAGLGWGYRCVAIYLPFQGDKDAYARVWQANRLQKKSAAKVIRDLRTQKVSAKRMAELQDGAPTTVSLPPSVSVSKAKVIGGGGSA